MDLPEYQGKQRLARHGIPLRAGQPAAAVPDAVDAEGSVGYPCAVKDDPQESKRVSAGRTPTEVAEIVISALTHLGEPGSAIREREVRVRAN